MNWAILGLIGVVAGAFGTIIGASGSFVLVPILLFLYPEATPATIAGISLSVSFFTALSGSVAYARLGRIDYRSGLLFMLAGVPGAIIGASLTSFLSRKTFQVIFAVILLLVAVYVMLRGERKHSLRSATQNHCIRRIADRQNNVYDYSFNRYMGIAIAFGVSLLCSLLGIGGGVIHVPALTHILCFPIHIATATSQFVVTATAFAAVITHLILGAYTQGIRRALVLSAAAIIGAQLGARLSRRMPGTLIVRLLAIALVLVSLRMLVAAF